MACGPFGDPKLIERPNDPHPNERGNLYVADLLSKAVYPPDDVIDLDAKYDGDMTRDLSGTPQEVRWQPVSAEGKFVEIPGGIGVAYFATWIETPENMTVQAYFPAYGHEVQNVGKMGSGVTVWVNSQKIDHYKVHPDNPFLLHPSDAQQITLTKGWNIVYARVFSSFAGLRFGIMLEGDKNKLFKLKVSSEPPKDKGRKINNFRD